MPNWKKIITSGSDASLNSLNIITSLTSSGLIYPNSDNGEESFIQTDGNGNLSLQYVKTIYEEIVNGETTNLIKGTPVYVSGSVGAASLVFKADPSNPSKMPAIYIVADTLSPAERGRGIALGLIKGVNTTGFPAGTEIYLAPGGGWTSTRPTGSVIVQILGYVTKEGNGGQGVILNPGPTTLPNLPSGSVWVGDNNSLPITVLTSSLSVLSASFSQTASYINPLQQTVLITGSLIVSASGTTNDLLVGSNKLFVSSSGRVGIGTITPNATFHINSIATPSIGESIARFTVSDADASLSIFNSSTTDELNQPTLLFEQPTSTAANAGFILARGVDSGTTPMFSFDARANGNVALTTRPLFRFRNLTTQVMDITAAGNIGINTTSPTEKLDVNGSVKANRLIINTPAISGIEQLQLWQISDADAYVRVENGTVTPSTFLPLLAFYQPTLSGVSAGAIQGRGIDEGTTPMLTLGSRTIANTALVNRPVLRISNFTTNIMEFLANGNVGIGTTIPNAKLDINGSAIITGSLTVSGSSTFTNIGPANFTGSLGVTGSTTLHGELNIDNKYYFINSLADLPTPVSSVITLADNATYLFTTEVDLLGNRLVCGQNTTILGGSSENCRIKSTGLIGTPLISSSYSIPMRGITIEADVALQLNASGSNEAIDWFGVNFTNCPTVGLIKNYNNVIMTDCAFLEAANCMFDGTIGTVGFITCLFNGRPGQTIISVSPTGSITRRFRPIYSSFIALSGETALNVPTSSIANAEGFILDTCNFSGGGTYIDGANTGSLKSLFVNNVGITNTTNVGHYYMINNTTDTTIGVPNVNVFVKAAGTTTVGIGNSPKWVPNGFNNRIVYSGSIAQDFKFTAVGTVQSPSANQVISVAIAKNGTVQTESEVTVRTGTSNQPFPFAIQDLTPIAFGDYVEVFVANTNSANVRVGDLNVIIDKIGS